MAALITWSDIHLIPNPSGFWLFQTNLQKQRWYTLPFVSRRFYIKHFVMWDSRIVCGQWALREDASRYIAFILRVLNWKHSLAFHAISQLKSVQTAILHYKSMYFTLHKNTVGIICRISRPHVRNSNHTWSRTGAQKDTHDAYECGIGTDCPQYFVPYLRKISSGLWVVTLNASHK